MLDEFVRYPRGVTDAQTPSDPADDDAYSALFRPEPEPVAPAIEPEAAPEVVAAEPESLPEPEFTSPSADTGRLFRSRGADASSGALAALGANQASHLRTMDTAVNQHQSAAEAVVDSLAPVAEVAAVPAMSAAALPSPTPGATSAPDQVFAAPILDTSVAHESPKESQEMAKKRRVGPGLNPLGVYIIVIGAGLVAGFLDSFITGSGLGWLTGIALLAASVFCALKVRVSDASVAVIAPPLAYGIAAVTVGQLGQSRAGGALISAVVNGFFTLADNWFWVISTTLIALAIVVVRARR